MTPESAYHLYDSIGVPPIHPESKGSAVQRVQQFIQTYLGASQKDIDELFAYTQERDGSWTCNVAFKQDKLGGASSQVSKKPSATPDEAKKNAKESAARAAWSALQKSEKYFKHFLIKVPPDSDGNPTSTLLQFFQMHSIHKQGDELQGIYRSYMHSTNGSSMPLFECRLTFKGVELGHGRGDTKRRAREEASRKVLRRLHEGINLLDKDSITRLSKYADPPGGVLSPVDTPG